MNKKNIFCYSLAIIIVVVFVILFGCPIRFFTGISCPGCGMTRACISFLKGKFSESLVYHPLVVLIPLMAILSICTVDRRIKGKNEVLIDRLWYVLGILFIFIYFIRMIIFNDKIVIVDINKGFIIRLMKYAYMNL